MSSRGQVGDFMLGGGSNPFSSAASATAASILPGLASLAGGNGGTSGRNPFQAQQPVDMQRKPPLDRWTLFRLNLWELRSATGWCALPRCAFAAVCDL